MWHLIAPSRLHTSLCPLLLGGILHHDMDGHHDGDGDDDHHDGDDGDHHDYDEDHQDDDNDAHLHHGKDDQAQACPNHIILNLGSGQWKKNTTALWKQHLPVPRRLRRP